jgi:hypothetical protein
MNSFSRNGKRHYLNLATAMAPVLALVISNTRNFQEKEQLITELQEALAKVKTLSGLLPICASCKKIRDDRGYWNRIEAYIGKHSDAQFSHGICPDCAKKLYPDLFEKEGAEDILSERMKGDFLLKDQPKKPTTYFPAVSTMIPASIHLMALAGTNF